MGFDALETVVVAVVVAVFPVVLVVVLLLAVLAVLVLVLAAVDVRHALPEVKVGVLTAVDALDLDEGRVALLVAETPVQKKPPKIVHARETKKER